MDFFLAVLLWEVIMITEITILFNWNANRREENYQTGKLLKYRWCVKLDSRSSFNSNIWNTRIAPIAHLAMALPTEILYSIPNSKDCSNCTSRYSSHWNPLLNSNISNCKDHSNCTSSYGSSHLKFSSQFPDSKLASIFQLHT
jgi:hypothetical protein